MDSYPRGQGSGVFVQVGAGAGDLDKRANCRDGFTEFVKSLPSEYVKKIILVEPNPFNIPLLKECWKDYPQSVIHEIGIVPSSHEGSTISFFYCPEDAPHYQVASVNKSHIQKHYGMECELKEITIPVMSLGDFIKKNLDDEIELLSLDIEGIDADVILDTDFESLNMWHLSFEHLHLGEQKSSVLAHLSKNNLEYVGPGVDHNGYDYLYTKKHDDVVQHDSNNKP